LVLASDALRSSFVTRSVATDADALSDALRRRAGANAAALVTLRPTGHVASTSTARLAHVEWSPHLEGEASVIWEDGAVRWFDVSRTGAAAPHATQPAMQGAYLHSICKHADGIAKRAVHAQAWRCARVMVQRMVGAARATARTRAR
jgi:hypothetical protein